MHTKGRGNYDTLISKRALNQLYIFKMCILIIYEVQDVDLDGLYNILHMYGAFIFHLQQINIYEHKILLCVWVISWMVVQLLIIVPKSLN